MSILATLMTLAGGGAAGAIVRDVVQRLLARPDRERDDAKTLRDELRGEVERMQKRIDSLEGRVENLTQERDQHRQQAIVAVGELQVAKAQIAGLERALAEVRAERDELRAELAARDSDTPPSP